MKEFKVKQNYIGKDISYAIKKEFPHLSNSSLNKAFRIKDIKVNDKRVNKTYILNDQDIVKIYLTDNVLFGIPKDIFYAYEDENIIIAYKPKGVVSNFETGKKNENIPYFDELVKKQKGANIRICHRLDTNTEGLVIFAKNDVSYDEIIKSFEKHQIHKEYIALVYGKPKLATAICHHYILVDKNNGYSKICETNVKNSKECITEYSTLKYIKEKNCSILNIKLHTGRTHQIRAHMKYLGTPVIGDSKYCTNEINAKFKLTSQVLFACKYSFNFEKESPLYYLNDIVVDISDETQEKIYKLLNNSN